MENTAPHSSAAVSTVDMCHAAPASSSFLTTASWPCLMASMRADPPSPSTALTLQPAASNSSITAMCPDAAASMHPVRLS